MTATPKWRLVARCDNNTASLKELQDLYDNDKAISYRTFAKHVDIEALAKELGYSYGRHHRGLRLSEDHYVCFKRSTFRKKPCYHLVWSAIDFIFQP
jgi:hypothetical protein